MEKVTPIQVYVAGASSERNERAKPVIAKLQALGFHITHDWTTSVDMNERNPITDTNVLRKCAENDYNGVKNCEMFVLLSPANASTGAWVELGIALASECFIYISEDNGKCIFGLMNDARYFRTDEELLTFLEEDVKAFNRDRFLLDAMKERVRG